MTIPQKLQPGDEIRVIAPARSLSLISDDIAGLAQSRLEELGFKVTFSKHCKEKDCFFSSSIESRIEDLHDAFADKNVKAILTVIGGFNSNQLLDYIDYSLIEQNPKILCGYSDITALANAITAKTGLVTYSGPHFSTWGMKKEFEYNLEYFKKCLMEEGDFEVKSSKTWSDDHWFRDQENRDIQSNEGFAVLNKGETSGTIRGGNLCTFNLLNGTEYAPDISQSILFLEDDGATEGDFAVEFDRNLQSLIHQPNFDKVKGIVMGRFQKSAQMNMDLLKYIVETKEQLKNIPIIANVDFGHTNPLITFPIGGTVKLVAGEGVELRILKH